MIAIHTKFIKPTNSHGARIKAYTTSWGDRKGFTATIPFPYEGNEVQSHFEAVKTLVAKNKLDWDLSNMRYGDSADGKGFSFCFDCSKVSA